MGSDKKIILGVVGLIAATIAILLTLPDNSVSTPDTLPWHITHPTPESTRIFGITLGETSLAEAEKTFKEEAEVSLFKPTDRDMGVEAFIEEVNFNGLKAKLVMTVAVPADQLTGMFNRGLRMNATGSGKRITLTPDDLDIVRKAPVSSLTYLPNVRLEESVITKRFGEPAERIKETKVNLTHWLYPQHGLDIILNPKEKPVLQYSTLKDFELLRAPLLASGEIVK